MMFFPPERVTRSVDPAEVVDVVTVQFLLDDADRVVLEAGTLDSASDLPSSLRLTKRKDGSKAYQWDAALSRPREQSELAAMALGSVLRLTGETETSQTGLDIATLNRGIETRSEWGDAEAEAMSRLLRAVDRLATADETESVLANVDAR